MIGIGVIGLGNVFEGPYRTELAPLVRDRRVAVRAVEGELMPVEVDDNAHVTIDFGNACFGVVTTGFTIQKYKTPAIETDREPLIRPEHGYHALEIMLAAQEAGRTGATVEIHSSFPAISYDAWPVVARDRRARHDSSS